MSTSFSAIAEDRAYFMPSPYDQRSEYLQRYPSLRSRYERERRTSRQWRRQSEVRPRDSAQDFSDLANQRDTETDESDIEMPDDDLTGMSLDDDVGLGESTARQTSVHNYMSGSSHPHPTIPPQLPAIRPESFSFSFEEAMNMPIAKADMDESHDVTNSHTSMVSSQSPASVDSEKSKLWLKSIQKSVDSKDSKWKDQMVYCCALTDIKEI